MTKKKNDPREELEEMKLEMAKKGSGTVQKTPGILHNLGVFFCKQEEEENMGLRAKDKRPRAG